MHMRSVPPDGVIKSTDCSPVLDDAIQITVDGEVEDGFSAVPFMSGRDEGLPTKTSDHNVCPTIYEDDDEEHVVIQKAEKDTRPQQVSLCA